MKSYIYTHDASDERLQIEGELFRMLLLYFNRGNTYIKIIFTWPIHCDW